jgi:phage tail sheath protein FI
MNNSGSLGTNGILSSGSSDNVRWQITGVDTGSGQFSLLIRQGDDTTTEPIVLETWPNLSLDPTEDNYIARVIGDSRKTLVTDGDGVSYIQEIGNYPNNSNYVYVSAVQQPTPNYFNNNGTAQNAFTGSIPTAASGTFTGATGDLFYGGGAAYYSQSGVTAVNIQGIRGDDYDAAISLMANQDDYRFNVISVPGLTLAVNLNQVTTLVNTIQSRGDAIAVVDTRPYDDTINEAVTTANGINSSYAATYWPWVQTIDPGTGQLVYVPASTLIPAVYAFNDSVSEPWFAPAGINRGGLDTVVRAERKLTQSQRNTLYTGNVNPIATFPGTGVVVYGQKTLQKKASALDRVNVRRLLIALKSYISQVANNLVFEQNTIATRNQFLSQVNPYLESVQQRQGLYAFRVIMDDSNNTPDVIDRNQMIGQIYLQPTKTAEFIYLDFNILPTGATFPA